MQKLIQFSTHKPFRGKFFGNVLQQKEGVNKKIKAEKVNKKKPVDSN